MIHKLWMALINSNTLSWKSNSFDQKINTYEENETTELRTGEYIQG